MENLENTNPLIKIFRSQASPRTNSVRNHKHTEFELSLILSGNGKYLVGEKRYDIEPHDVFLFSTNEPHCITDIADGGMELINIQFSPYYIFEDFAQADFMKIFFDRSDRFLHRLDRNNETIPRIREHILTAEREMREHTVDYGHIVKFSVVSALILICRNFGYVNINSRFSVNQENFLRVYAAVKYIDEHLAEPLTLSALAETAGFNKTYFCTLFKSYYGMSVWEYIEIKRIDKAKKMLKENPFMTIISIANECGFNNTANFNKIFKKVTATTPNSYRA